MDRVETGPLQVGDDWPGVFIRGDNALMGYAPALAALLRGEATFFERASCESLLALLNSCGAVGGENPKDLQVIHHGTRQSAG